MSDLREDHYRNLGRRTGPRAAADVQAATRDYWAGSGGDGARWLVGRLAAESNAEAIDGAWNALADIGAPAIGPILEAVEDARDIAHLEAYATALGWIARNLAAGAGPPATS